MSKIRMRLILLASISLAACDRGDTPSIDETESEQALTQSEETSPSREDLSGSREDPLIIAARANAAETINFAGRFSTSYVDCGPGCGSYWLLDRQTGRLSEFPSDALEGEMIWSFDTRANSDVAEVIYGPMDGMPSNCFAQNYRWTDSALSAISSRTPVTCPS